MEQEEDVTKLLDEANQIRGLAASLESLMELIVSDGNHAYCGDLSLSYDSLATQATEMGRKLAYMAIHNIAKLNELTFTYQPPS